MVGRGDAVLVVDDDVELLMMVEMLLDEAGYRVVTATEGRDALEKVAQEMPTVILLDMKMPEMDGWEFARQFRSRHGRQAPIVVLTAAEDAEQRAEQIEANGYLSKPFEIDDLVRLVGSYVDTRV